MGSGSHRPLFLDAFLTCRGNPFRFVDAKSCNCLCDIFRTPRFSEFTALGLCSAIAMRRCCAADSLGIFFFLRRSRQHAVNFLDGSIWLNY